ncbi:hypothetical protein CCHOA_10205 [Corynebacterium choanae]|uniref:Uncharacterized protein n=1 Tax=Corynebacterium choanae TaxID=1862358 RepID=A0A3G6JE58_9CORY|nr:hypothetical protein CCHOA_10205 [Corynebacterium choanae]
MALTLQWSLLRAPRVIDLRAYGLKGAFVAAGMRGETTLGVDGFLPVHSLPFPAADMPPRDEAPFERKVWYFGSPGCSPVPEHTG